MEEEGIVTDQDDLDTSILSDEELQTRLEGPTEEKPEEVAEVKEPEQEKEVVEPEKVVLEKSEYDKIQQQLKDKELFIQRRNTEIGDLRKQLEAKRQTLENELETFDQFDPRGIAQREIQLAQTTQQLADLQVKEVIETNRVVLKDRYPNFQELVDDMSEIATGDLKGLGYDDTTISQLLSGFKANPYAEQTGTLLNLADRARLNRENRELKSKLKDLEKQPEEVLKKVEKAFNTRPTVTASAGQASASKQVVASDQISILSDAELEEMIKKGGV